MTPQIEGGPSRAGFPGARPPFLLGGKGGKCFSPLAQHPERSEGHAPYYPPRKWPLWALFGVDPLGHTDGASSVPIRG